MKNIKTNVILSGTMLMVLMNVIPVQAEGTDVQPIKNWILSYLVPFKNILAWGVPIVTGIACLIVGLRYLNKEAEGEQQRSYFVQVKPILIVAAVLMAIDIFLQAFSIVGK